MKYSVKIKLTKKAVESHEPFDKDFILRDTEIKGFICKITPKGKRVYMLYYRARDGRERKPSLGYHGVITCDQARDLAKNMLALVTQNQDPSLARQKLRAAPTIDDLKSRYLEEYAKSKKRESSYLEDIRLWNTHISPRIGKHKITSISYDDIQEIHSSLNKTPISANRVISLLSKFFNLTEIWGVRANNSNPCKHITKYPETKRERFLSLEEITRLFETLALAEQNKTTTQSVINAIHI